MRLGATPHQGFPFNLPIIANLERLELVAPITFLVGDNGSGKSTLLEATALAAGSISVAGRDPEEDPGFAASRELAGWLRLVFGRKPKRGFFLRAEDFLSYAHRLEAERAQLLEFEKEFNQDYEGEGRRRAVGAVRGQRMALEQRYGESLQNCSHGEGFLRFFQERLVPEGLYFLDEPETPLSPSKQLAFISLLKQMVEEDCQLVIATHSPMLMAAPDSQILFLDDQGIHPTPWEELEHVQLTRDFLNAPARYLRHL